MRMASTTGGAATTQVYLPIKQMEKVAGNQRQGCWQGGLELLAIEAEFRCPLTRQRKFCDKAGLETQ